MLNDHALFSSFSNMNRIQDLACFRCFACSRLLFMFKVQTTLFFVLCCLCLDLHGVYFIHTFHMLMHHFVWCHALDHELEKYTLYTHCLFQFPQDVWIIYFMLHVFASFASLRSFALQKVEVSSWSECSFNLSKKTWLGKCSGQPSKSLSQECSTPDG